MKKSHRTAYRAPVGANSNKLPSAQVPLSPCFKAMYGRDRNNNNDNLVGVEDSAQTLCFLKRATGRRAGLLNLRPG